MGRGLFHAADVASLVSVAPFPQGVCPQLPFSLGLRMALEQCHLLMRTGRLARSHRGESVLRTVPGSAGDRKLEGVAPALKVERKLRSNTDQESIYREKNISQRFYLKS